MPSLLSSYDQTTQQALMDDLNYLNMGEIKAFCKKHAIPYSIWIETSDAWRRTQDEDRKGIVLNRIRHYLGTGHVPDATRLPANVVCLAPLSKNIGPADRLFYGQYDKKNEVMMALLADLTGGRFKDGAIARILAREFWCKGTAPSFQEYAAAWLSATENHQRPNPEWAFLSDLAERKDIANWKQLRAEKAKQVLGILNNL